MNLFFKILTYNAFFVLIAVSNAFAGAGRDHDEHGHDGHSEGPEPVVVTQYTHNSELFMAHPPLVQGEPTRLIIHLTRLSDFTPITKGSLEVRLVPAAGKPYTLTTERPARTGFFSLRSSRHLLVW